MFSNRRLAKRSIVGTKISAPLQDGRYCSGVIRAQRSGNDTGKCNAVGSAVYGVHFDNGEDRDVPAKNLVGPGFQSIATVVLRGGQKVFITLNGREVSGLVRTHNTPTGEVVIGVKMPTGEEFDISKRLEDVRLLESRKSARLVDQDTDYSKLADFHPEIKKRTVSHEIEVPAKAARCYHKVHEHDNGDNEMEVMDEQMAALVLTSLSCSPASPQIPSILAEKAQSHTEGPLSSSLTSSGVFSFHSDRSNSSPPLACSAPSSYSILSSSWPQDEGLDLEENVCIFYDEEEPKKKKTQSQQVQTVFQCTWPGCEKIDSLCPGIEKHVREVHLKKEGTDSDGEEEFYYTEVEKTVDKSSECFSEKQTPSSPPGVLTENPTASVGNCDHDYQKKEHRIYPSHSVETPAPSSGNYLNKGPSTPIPISMPQIKKSLSWQNRTSITSIGNLVLPPVRVTKPSPQERLQQHQTQSPKTHMLASHKKSRSEVRKCRKVYGMENREMWCTQCKWKKACSRFVD